MKSICFGTIRVLHATAYPSTAPDKPARVSLKLGLTGDHKQQYADILMSQSKEGRNIPEDKTIETQLQLTGGDKPRCAWSRMLREGDCSRYDRIFDNQNMKIELESGRIISKLIGKREDTDAFPERYLLPLPGQFSLLCDLLGELSTRKQLNQSIPSAETNRILALIADLMANFYQKVLKPRFPGDRDLSVIEQQLGLS